MEGGGRKRRNGDMQKSEPTQERRMFGGSEDNGQKHTGIQLISEERRNAQKAK